MTKSNLKMSKSMTRRVKDTLNSKKPTFGLHPVSSTELWRRAEREGARLKDRGNPIDMQK
ncbi:hypothetical protein ACSS6W_009639 [Trichoderma asperelloides]